MIDPFYLLLVGLAVYRAAYMVVKEEGPFSIFVKLRSIDQYQHTWVGRGLNCPNCVSFWLGLIVAICWWLGYYQSPIVVGIVIWFDLMFGVFILTKVIYKFLDR
jgi:hypothetical protein